MEKCGAWWVALVHFPRTNAPHRCTLVTHALPRSMELTDPTLKHRDSFSSCHSSTDLLIPSEQVDAWRAVTLSVAIPSEILSHGPTFLLFQALLAAVSLSVRSMNNTLDPVQYRIVSFLCQATSRGGSRQPERSFTHDAICNPQIP